MGTMSKKVRTLVPHSPGPVLRRALAGVQRREARAAARVQSRSESETEKEEDEEEEEGGEEEEEEGEEEEGEGEFIDELYGGGTFVELFKEFLVLVREACWFTKY